MGKASVGATGTALEYLQRNGAVMHSAKALVQGVVVLLVCGCGGPGASSPAGSLSKQTPLFDDVVVHVFQRKPSYMNSSFGDGHVGAEQQRTIGASIMLDLPRMADSPQSSVGLSARFRESLAGSDIYVIDQVTGISSLSVGDTISYTGEALTLFQSDNGVSVVVCSKDHAKVLAGSDGEEHDRPLLPPTGP